MLDSTARHDAQPPLPPAAPLPPPYTCLHRHPILPTPNHDETARMNFLINLISHAGSRIAPGMAAVYQNRVAPKFQSENGRACATGREVRDAMSKDGTYQTWAALRRDSQEARQQYGRSMVFRQIEQLPIPRYVTEVDNHCMPGGYTTARDGYDISAAANYEAGHYVVAGGGTGGKSDVIGRSLAAYLRSKYPDLNPRKVVDVGAGGGFNTLPIASAFPDAEVIAVDVAAPMLRYGAARARAMGVANVTFLQADGQSLPFETNSVDLVVTAMLWHETALTPMRTILREIHRVLRPGGVVINFEQPNFDPETPPFERFMRDWDSWYNAEPFWAKLHTLSYRDETIAAGFAPAAVFEDKVAKVDEEGVFPTWVRTVNRHDAEHGLMAKRAGHDQASRPVAGGLYVFGAVKS
jgi:ubiquinone/menaquinone biosynthesis C-methylase UbiE